MTLGELIQGLTGFDADTPYDPTMRVFVQVDDSVAIALLGVDVWDHADWGGVAGECLVEITLDPAKGESR